LCLNVSEAYAAGGHQHDQGEYLTGIIDLGEFFLDGCYLMEKAAGLGFNLLCIL
jgi:hypothetical protein